MTNPAAAGPTQANMAGGVQSIQRAVQVLGLFTPAEPEHPLGTISRRLGLPRSTTHRILSSLRGAGLIAHGSRAGTYRLGHEALRLGNVAQTYLRSGDTVYRRLRDLNHALDVSVGLSILVDDEVLVIDWVESALPFRLAYQVGARRPAYSTASGHVSLSGYSDQEFEEYCERVGGARQSSLPAALRAAVRDRVHQTRSTGFACMDHPEYPTSLTCFAVPVPIGIGQEFAALSISGPTQTIRAQTTHSTLARMRAVAGSIGAECALAPVVARFVPDN